MCIRDSPSSDRSVFSQLSPGISLILLGSDADERLVVRGRYEVAAADPGSGSSNVIQLGETAQLGDAQITVQANSFLTNRPEAPTGFGFFLIDFVVQNVGLTAIDSSAYRFTLSDELGNQYALNPIASRLGNFPPLGGFVNAGQSVSATAGYQIPAGLVSPNLTWTVTGPDGTEIQAVLAFTAGGDAGQSAVISLQEATITPDLNNLIIVGQVTNVGAQPLVIAPEDISLRTPTGSDYLLLATNPPFPWTVPPNQTLQFAVTYQRPIGSPSAVFTLLSQPFELSGLQSVSYTHLDVYKRQLPGHAPTQPGPAAADAGHGHAGPRRGGADHHRRRPHAHTHRAADHLHGHAHLR